MKLWRFIEDQQRQYLNTSPHFCNKSKPKVLSSSTSDWNWTWTQNHLVHKRTLNHLVKWLSVSNDWVFVYKLTGSGFEFSCSHLNFRFCACFEQGVPWHPGNYRVWIHFETHTWHEKNIQSVKWVTLLWTYPKKIVRIIIDKIFEIK